MDKMAPHILQLEKVASVAERFDIIHYHVDYFHFPISRRLSIPNVTTLHGRLDLPDLVGLYREFDEMPLVSISDSQRQPLPWANWVATVYHGLPEDLYSLHEEPEDYLAFLGRMSVEKRVDRAIEIAKRLGMKLKIAAKVDPADREYFEQKIKGLLDHPLVEFIGEIGEREKNEFLGNAYALLFPIDWCEPFGLAMIEAMACGTPTIAYRCGSVPEVIDEGITGFVVGGIDEAVAAVDRVGQLDRPRCREQFLKRFSATRMAEDYLAAYQRLIDARSGIPLEELTGADG
jgi:glycosyltransferase involved in cell wall biosynthesis